MSFIRIISISIPIHQHEPIHIHRTLEHSQIIPRKNTRNPPPKHHLPHAGRKPKQHDRHRHARQAEHNDILAPVPRGKMRGDAHCAHLREREERLDQAGVEAGVCVGFEGRAGGVSVHHLADEGEYREELSFLPWSEVLLMGWEWLEEVVVRTVTDSIMRAGTSSASCNLGTRSSGCVWLGCPPASSRGLVSSSAAMLAVVYSGFVQTGENKMLDQTRRAG